jgi:hypothetical protein
MKIYYLVTLQWNVFTYLQLLSMMFAKIFRNAYNNLTLVLGKYFLTVNKSKQNWQEKSQFRSLSTYQ